MARGGKRENAGRPKGQPNKKTQEQIQAVEAEGITPLEYMLRVLRDEGQDPAVRLDAANKAAPYVHAKLSSVEMKADVTHKYEDMTDEELDQLIEDLLHENGISGGS